MVAISVVGCTGVSQSATSGVSQPAASGVSQAQAASQSHQPPDTSQSSEAGQVQVVVTRQTDAATPTFEVTLDTHSVDLDGVDLGQLAVLRTGTGAEVRPTTWDAPNGGHHRKGHLSFPATTADGKSVIDEGMRSVELVIRDVAGVAERSFRWTL
ncbi:MAG: hypothetical protein HY329_05080 [Chloroflexi bacterium]|nr:hypothetical protein [Chloroflexota bacterium]